MDRPDRPPRPLLVCVENSCRSQMVEAFARAFGGPGVEACSAGSRPSGSVNPRAVASMARAGIDLSGQRSKGLEDVPAGEFDAVLTLGCGEACPAIPAALREDWALPDPKGMEPDEFDAVRDEVRRRVEDLLARLGASRG